MAVNISGVSYNKPIVSTQSRQKPAQPSIAELQQQKLAGNGMSLERFRELFESDAPIEEKWSEIQEAFGGILDKDALETSIKAAREGKMSIEEIYRRALARSNGLTYTEEDSMAIMKESQRVRRPEVFSGRNDPANLQKAAPIMNRVYAGHKLTASEKQFLKKYYPEAYDYAIKAEQEAARVKKAMDGAKSPEEAEQILRNAQLAAVSSNSNGSNQALIQILSKINKNDYGASMFDIEV